MKLTDTIGNGVDQAWRLGVKPAAIAVFFVYVAFLWTLLLQMFIPYPFLFLFLGAVMGSAWLGGAIAGGISVVLSTLVVEYFFLPPAFSFKLNHTAEVYFVSYIVTAVAVSWVSAAKKRTETAIRESRDLLEQRVQERTAELERSNQEIQESARRLRELTEVIPQQIWSATPQGAIDYCNQHLLDYVGLPIGWVAGDRFAQVFHPEDRDLFASAWSEAIAQGAMLEGEWRVKGAGGEYRWFLVRGIPQRSTTGEIVRWYATHIEIEGRHRAEEELLQSRAELAHLSRVLSMGELTSSIAHEIGQPLTAMVTQGYACLGWLKAEPANVEKARASAERIVEEGTRAGAVVSRVRALFRREDTPRQRLNLNALILESGQLLRDECVRRGIVIRFELAGELPPVEADRVQIQQVLVNLAMNAMDALAGVTERPRSLVIRSLSDGAQEVLVQVEDNGVGLPEQAAEKVFDAFFTTKNNGLGMGLPISRSIIEAHEGRLWAASRKPHGTSVYFSLPVCQ